jgi:hypothetical protein
MWVFAAVMIVTALWFVLGAVLHHGHGLTRDTAGEVWLADLACHHALPSSHPLARLTRSNG